MPIAQLPVHASCRPGRASTGSSRCRQRQPRAGGDVVSRQPEHPLRGQRAGPRLAALRAGDRRREAARRSRPRASSAALPGFAVSPDGKFVAAIGAGPQGRCSFRSMAESPASIAGVEDGEFPLRFSPDGTLALSSGSAETCRRASRASTSRRGKRELWKDLIPADPAGVERISNVLVDAGRQGLRLLLRAPAVRPLRRRGPEVEFPSGMTAEGKPFSPAYPTLESLRALGEMWNDSPPMKHFGAQARVRARGPRARRDRSRDDGPPRRPRHRRGQRRRARGAVRPRDRHGRLAHAARTCARRRSTSR